MKIRDEGFVRNKAVYIALGILPDGTKEILGIWIEQTEGAKFWLRVMNELKNRGAGDILIAVVDGLKGFPEAINAVFPQDRPDLHRPPDPSLARVRVVEGSQACDAALREIYRAKDAEAGIKALEDFEAGYWGQISGHRAELAAQLGPCRSLLRLPRERAPDHIHNERDRGAELEVRRAVRRAAISPVTMRR